MDTTERDVIRGQLADLERFPPASFEEMIQKQQLAAKYYEQLNNFISETTETAQVLSDWRRVSNELRTIRNGNNDSLIAPTTLPLVQRTQHNRNRLEETDFLLLRQPLFSHYETAILPSQKQFFGIIGPKGYGKSTFLHFFATKYCCDSDYLVVYLPSCPTQTDALKRSLARAFYRGCRITELTGYKELTRNVSLYDMLVKCIEFAESKNKALLLVIDQMKNEPRDFFDSTIDAICNLSGYRIIVIMSSSISNRFSSVFGSRIQSLPRYSQKITPAEAALLATQTSETEITAADLAGLPFQVAAEILKGVQVSIADLAKDLAEDLLTNAADASRQQAYFYLQMAADSTRKVHERDCFFGSTLDGDHFFVDEDINGLFFIAEHREGFAAEVIAIMRSRQGDYEQYLLQLLDNPNFMTLDSGARGRVVEDCFAIILRGQHKVRLPFIKIPGGGKTSPSTVSLEAATKLVFDVPGGDEAVPESIEWLSDSEVLVFVPLNRQYKGIDFIIARRAENTLYIYFVQCTIQLPQDHPICETQLYEQWQNLLVSASKSRKYFSYLVFLTPHSTNLQVPGKGSTAAFFRPKTKLHVQFARIEGAHPLLDKIKTRFAHL